MTDASCACFALSAQLMLFVLTMKRQIRHMIKHRYLPFTRGKQARADAAWMLCSAHLCFI